MHRDGFINLLHASSSEDEESDSMSSVYQDCRVSSSRHKLMVDQRSNTYSELSPICSYSTSMDSSGFGSCIKRSSPGKRQHHSIGGISKHKGITKSTVSLSKRGFRIDVQNDCNEPPYEHNYRYSVSTPIDSVRSNDELEGYESGAAERSINKCYLCKECNHLYEKARRGKQATQQITKNPDPSHWSSKFWMMVNRIPSQKKNPWIKREPNRYLNILAQKLRRSKPANKLHLRCFRIHSFLKRNLRTCIKTKKQLETPKGRLKRKRTNFAPSLKSKSKEPVPSSYKNKNLRKRYTVELDSNEDDDEVETPNIKRYDVRGVNRIMKSLQCPVSMRNHCKSLVSATVHSGGLQAAVQDEDHLCLLKESSDSDPQVNCSAPEATSSPFAHVQRGSFRELLERLNSGSLRSGIVDENKI